ncbi:MAG: hypothetical protein IKE46_11860, partial [Selenomonadaceae bacterium]|nr:hypothetical protein [Selenomonadaceae bacterium]
SASDKTKLNGIAAYANNYTLPTASSSTLGGVKIGSGIAVSSGVISVPTVTSSANGLMSSIDKKKLDSLASITTAGDNITISGGKISGTANTTYTAGSNITISGTTISGTANTTYSTATTTTAGLMSADDKKKLNNLASITSAGTNITISGGTISAADTTYNVATSSANGLMSSTDKKKLDSLASITTAGNGISISGGTISASSTYTLPTASTATKGGVKIGNGLSMNGDTLNVTITGIDDLENWNATSNLYLRPAVLGSTPSTVNGAIWYVSDSGTSSDSSDVLVFGTTASTVDGAVWFA